MRFPETLSLDPADFPPGHPKSVPYILGASVHLMKL